MATERDAADGMVETMIREGKVDSEAMQKMGYMTPTCSSRDCLSDCPECRMSSSGEILCLQNCPDE